MTTTTISRKKIMIEQETNIEQIKKKAAFWDEFMEFVEDKFLGNLMESTEKEKNVSLAKAKKMLR